MFPITSGVTSVAAPLAAALSARNRGDIGHHFGAIEEQSK